MCQETGWSIPIEDGSRLVAASEVARELLGIREMLCEIGAVPKLPMIMLVDNRDAIRQIEGEASSLKPKCIDVRVKFVCDFARRGVVLAQYVQSDQMQADLLMKALDATKLAKLRALMRVG